MITVVLQGGLGNVLFQVAALDSISKQSQREPFLEDEKTPPTHHSDQDYLTTVLAKWKSVPRRKAPVECIDEPSYHFREWSLSGPVAKLRGYFQNYRYISESFVESLTLPTVAPLPGAFLHIRGGDYVRHPFHDVGLSTYYERAVSHFPPGTHFHVFTNDVSYAKSLPILQKVSHSFVTDSDEVVCLAKMKACTVGGICANSTFSWWGAYLNRGTRMLILPSKWFNDPRIYVEGYFFPGSFICQV